MAWALAFLERYHKDGDEFLSHIVRVTGDETRDSFVNVEIKEQPNYWMHTHSPHKPKTFNRTLSACQKAEATVFWERKGVPMVEFLRKGTKMTLDVYVETHKKNCIGPFRTNGVEC
jgi:hypothetical protein